MSFGNRTMDLLAEPKPSYNPDERERWVNLKSEVLRRFGSSQEGIAFVEEWMQKVEPETRTILMLRKTALHLAQGEKEAASEAVRQAWATHTHADPSLMVSMANVAVLAGEMGIAAELGKRLLRSRSALAGLYLFLYAMFFSSNPILVKLPSSVGPIALLLVPSLRPLVVAVLFVLAFGALISWAQRLVALGFSLALIAIVLTVAYTLFLLASASPIGGILGALVLGAFVFGVALVLWRSRQGRSGTRQRGD